MGWVFSPIMGQTWTLNKQILKEFEIFFKILPYPIVPDYIKLILKIN